MSRRFSASGGFLSGVHCKKKSQLAFAQALTLNFLSGVATQCTFKHIAENPQTCACAYCCGKFSGEHFDLCTRICVRMKKQKKAHGVVWISACLDGEQEDTGFFFFKETISTIQGFIFLLPDFAFYTLKYSVFIPLIPTLHHKASTAADRWSK